MGPCVLIYAVKTGKYEELAFKYLKPHRIPNGLMFPANLWRGVFKFQMSLYSPYTKTVKISGRTA